MNTDFLSFEEAARLSNHSVRKRAFKLWLFSHLMMTSESRKYLYIIHHYLRWVDDYVDKPGKDPLLKIEFVERELKIIDHFSNGIRTEFRFPEEYYIFYFINYALEKSKSLIDEIKIMIGSILIDAKRLHTKKIFTNEEIQCYIRNQMNPFFNVMHYFLSPGSPGFRKNPSFGDFLFYVVAARDFYEDLEAGFINITGEDISRYNLDVNNLDNETLNNYIKDRYINYLKILDHDILTLKKYPPKVKLFWLAGYSVLTKELLRIKYYNYKFGKIRKEIIKEIMIFFHSFFLNIKALYNIF